MMKTILKLFDSESRAKKELRPHDGHTLRMYTCGPTIYDFAHIGNFRTYVVEDLLRRTLRFFSYSVCQVMNLTDVDDKTIRGAIAKKISLSAFTNPFRDAFFEDRRTLHLEEVEHYPAATDYIPQMIAMVQKLLDSGHAYRSSNGSIYFSIRSFPAYGRLSHLTLEELQVNASGQNEADEYEKDNLADFVLWKAYDATRDGQIFWESPFGPGRPGWHIECSAMATALLGKSVDLHCGGVDNLFPHHENEIAQSECASGCCFAHHWLHVEHLLVEHRKMSKSLGNFYTLRDLLTKGYRGVELRYQLLSVHYRSQLNFTFAGLDGARATVRRIEDFARRLRAIREESGTVPTERLQQAQELFTAALADDLNISAALAVLFDLIRDIHSLSDQNLLSAEGARAVLDLLESFDRVLAIMPPAEEEIPKDLSGLLEEREAARKAKDFRRSDQLRDAIHARGYAIEDTPNGAQLRRI
jgi:cysteinyl-tRNA synthetase